MVTDGTGVGGRGEDAPASGGMSCAEFKMLRESMGLTAGWLAARWGVAEFSVQRWERERTPPERMVRALSELKSVFDDEVKRDASMGAVCLIVPRLDVEAPRGLPAAWFRAVAQRVSESCGTRVLYFDDENDAEGVG